MTEQNFVVHYSLAFRFFGCVFVKEEERKMRNLAVIPPMLLDSRQRRRCYHNQAGLLEDAAQVNLESMSRMLYWTAEEKDIFREKYLQRPKNFGFIAAALENKASVCHIPFYLVYILILFCLHRVDVVNEHCMY